MGPTTRHDYRSPAPATALRRRLCRIFAVLFGTQSAKYLILWWAVLGSNQWPLPCEGSDFIGISQTYAHTRLSTTTWEISHLDFATRKRLASANRTIPASSPSCPCSWSGRPGCRIPVCSSSTSVQIEFARRDMSHCRAQRGSWQETGVPGRVRGTRLDCNG